MHGSWEGPGRPAQLMGHPAFYSSGPGWLPLIQQQQPGHYPQFQPYWDPQGVELSPRPRGTGTYLPKSVSNYTLQRARNSEWCLWMFIFSIFATFTLLASWFLGVRVISISRLECMPLLSILTYYMLKFVWQWRCTDWAGLRTINYWVLDLCNEHWSQRDQSETPSKYFWTNICSHIVRV
jgi:hypothetical protein